MRRRLGVVVAVVIMVASVVVIVAPQASAVTLAADYQFQNTRSSSGTAPALTDLGTNSFATETVDGVRRTVLTFPQGNGLDLFPAKDTCCGPPESYTVVILFNFENTDGFRRLLDFKNGSQDSGLYVLNNNLTFFGPTVGGTGGSILPDTYVQVVLTRDDSKNVVGYVNGTQEFTFVDSGDQAWIDGADHLRFFQDDDSVAGEQSAGTVARIRLFDGAMTPSEVGALDRVPGEDDPPPECQSDPNAQCGGPEDNDVQGTSSDDFIFTGGGDDIVDGGAGADEIFGGSGNDRLSGGGDDDHLSGGTGRDVLVGDVDTVGRMAEDEAGDDTLDGGAGADEILGQAGDDVLNGDGGNDVLKGGGGTNVLRGGPGNDKCFVTNKDTTKSCETIKKKRRNF